MTEIRVSDEYDKIREYIRKHRVFTLDEIADTLGFSKNSLRHELKFLISAHEVEHVEICKNCRTIMDAEEVCPRCRATKKIKAFHRLDKDEKIL